MFHRRNRRYYSLTFQETKELKPPFPPNASCISVRDHAAWLPGRSVGSCGSKMYKTKNVDTKQTTKSCSTVGLWVVHQISSMRSKNDASWCKTVEDASAIGWNCGNSPLIFLRLCCQRLRSRQTFSKRFPTVKANENAKSAEDLVRNRLETLFKDCARSVQMTKPLCKQWSLVNSSPYCSFSAALIIPIYLRTVINW